MSDAEAVRQRRRGRRGIRRTSRARHPDVLVHHLFEACVEDEADPAPVFVYDYPASLCPLTKRQRDNPAIAERFELYVRGMELANAYTELNDPVTQEQTFRQQLAGLPEEDSMAKMDDDFVRPCATACRRPAAWASASTACDAADQHADDPRRDPVPAAAARKVTHP